MTDFIDDSVIFTLPLEPSFLPPDAGRVDLASRFGLLGCPTDYIVRAASYGIVSHSAWARRLRMEEHSVMSVSFCITVTYVTSCHTLAVNPGGPLLDQFRVHVHGSHVNPPDRPAILIGILHDHPRFLPEGERREGLLGF